MNFRENRSAKWIRLDSDVSEPQQKVTIFLFLIKIVVKGLKKGIFFHLVIALFLYLLKTSVNLWFSNVFKGYREKPVAQKRLTCE